MSYGIITLYISEISPKAWRGRLVSIIGPVYSMSLIVQFAANCGYATFCLGWRISLSTQAALGLFYAIIMLLLPRTPRQVCMYINVIIYFLIEELSSTIQMFVA